MDTESQQNRISTQQQQQQQLRVTEDGRSLRVQTDLPHLVSLGGGRLSTAVTLLPLPEGKTMIGTVQAMQPQDIVIRGAGIQDQHAYIINHDDIVTLYPLSELTSIDSLRISKPTRLSQGCMLCFGRSSYFRFNHPIEAQRLRSNVRGSSDRNSVSTSDTPNPATIPIYDTPRKIHDKSGYYDSADSCMSNGNRSVEVFQCINSLAQQQTATVSTMGECCGRTEEPPAQQLYDNVDSVRQQQQSRRSRREAFNKRMVNSGNITKATKKSDIKFNCEDATTHCQMSSPMVSHKSTERVVHKIAPSSTNSADTDQCQPTDQHIICEEEECVSLPSVEVINVSGSVICDNLTGAREVIRYDDQSDDASSPTVKNLPWIGYDNILQLKEAIVASAVAKLASGTSGYNKTVSRRLGKTSASKALSSSSSANTSPSAIAPDAIAANATVSQVGNKTDQGLEAAHNHERTTAAHGQQTVTSSGANVVSVETEVSDITEENPFRQQHTDAGPVSADVLRIDCTSIVTSSVRTMDITLPSLFSSEQTKAEATQIDAVENEHVLNTDKTTGLVVTTDMRKKDVCLNPQTVPQVSANATGQQNPVTKVYATKVSWKHKQPKNGETNSSSAVSNKEKPPICKPSNAPTDKVLKKAEKQLLELKKDNKKEFNVKVKSVSSDHLPDAGNCAKSETTGSTMSFIKSLLTRSRSPSPKRGIINERMSTATKIKCRSPSPSPRSPSTSISSTSFAKRLSDPLKVSFKQIMGEGSKSDNKQFKEQKDQLLQAPEKPKRVLLQEHLHQGDKGCNGKSYDEARRDKSHNDGVEGNQVIKLTTISTANLNHVTIAKDVEQITLTRCTEIGDECSVSKVDADIPSFARNECNVAHRSISTCDCPAQIAQVDDFTTSVSCENLLSTTKFAPKKVLERACVDVSSDKSLVNVVESSSSNPWIVNLKDMNLITPNLEQFRGEKLFQMGTATTSVILPGFQRSCAASSGSKYCSVRGSAGKLSNVSHEQHPGRSDAIDVSLRNLSPIYDTVYVENCSKVALITGICESISELGYSGIEVCENVGLHECSTASVASAMISEANNMHDLKSTCSEKGKESSIQTDRDYQHFGLNKDGNGGALMEDGVYHNGICGVELSRTTSKMAPDGRRFKRASSGNSRLDSGASLKSGYLDLTLRSGHRFSDTLENLVDGEDVDVRNSNARLDGRQCQTKMTKCATLPRNSRLGPQDSFLAPTVSESTSFVEFPSLKNQNETCRENIFHSHYDDDYCSRRDTLISFIGGGDDLSSSQQDLANLYREQKAERQREQELARREKERWEKIEKMWRDFETSSCTVAPSSSSCGSIVDRSDSSPMNVTTDKPCLRNYASAELNYCTETSGIKDHWRNVGSGNRCSQNMGPRTPAQIDESLDELLEEFNLTVTQQVKASSTPNQVTLINRQPLSSSEEAHTISMGRNAIERSSARRVTGEVGAFTEGMTSVRPRASSCSQRPAALSRSTQAVDKALFEQKLGTTCGLASRSTFDLENGYSSMRQNSAVHSNKCSDVTSSGSDINGTTSLSNSLYALDVHRDDSEGQKYGVIGPGIGIEEQLKQIQAHLRRKQVAIEALELERRRCLDLERRLQDEIKSNIRQESTVDLGHELGTDKDAVVLRDRRRTKTADLLYDDKELPATSTTSMRPLTRYLPTRSKVLDLRQFVESSGHNLAQSCKHIEVTTTCCRGFLYKMAGRGLRKWNRRWFVLDRSRRCLVYYADKLESIRAARGTIYFQSITDVFVDHLQSIRSPSPSVTFCVKTLERTLNLMAPTTESMRIWVDVIFTGAEGYQEFT